MMMSMVLVVSLVIVGLGVVKGLDLTRRRAEADLEARISDALCREPGLMRIMPVVYLARGRGAPAAVELIGRVATVEQRRMTWRLVREEGARAGRYLRIEDRILVLPSDGGHSATHAA